MGFKDLLLRTRPLIGKERDYFFKLNDLLDKNDLKQIKKLKKQFKIAFSEANLGVSLVEDAKFPQLKAKKEDTAEFAEEINKKIRDKVKQSLFAVFAGKAYETISSTIAPNILGFEHVKKATALQLFADKPLHILLLGDPGTGKTDIIRSSSSYAPISSFGLGSGTSGAGLVVTVIGKEVVKGLLPSAHGGICAIDELNLMKEDSRAGLYNAMEKGFVTYNKGGHSYKFDAKVNVIATANPIGDKFIGKDVKSLRKQLPFDSALMTRFHLVFLVRKPNVKEFLEITKKITKGEAKELKQADVDFVKGYVAYANAIAKIKFPQSLEPEVVSFIEKVKKNEHNYLSEISPRLVIGFINLAKASARINLRDAVTKEDVETVQEIVRKSLEV